MRIAPALLAAQLLAALAAAQSTTTQTSTDTSAATATSTSATFTATTTTTTTTTTSTSSSSSTSSTSTSVVLPFPTGVISHALYNEPTCSSRPTFQSNFSTGVCYPGSFWCSDIAGIPARQCGQSYVRTSLVFGCSNNNLNASMIWYPCANCTCLGSSVYYNYSVGDCYPQGSFGEAYYCSQSIPQYSVATRLRPSTALQVSLAMFVILVTVVL